MHNGELLVSGPTELSLAHGSFKDVLTLNYGDFRSSSTAGSSNDGMRHHVKAVSYGKEVWSVDLKGDMNVNSLSVSNGSVLLESGLLTAHNVKVRGALDILGAVNLEDSLTIGSGFALTPGGMTVDVNTHSGTLFELRSRQEGFNGSLLEIHATGVESSMIKAVVEGQVTFDLSSSGHMALQGLRLSSGGIAVESGGLSVQAGGVTVKGGLTIETGGLSINEADFKAGSMTIDSSSVDKKLMRSISSNPHFVGSLLSLACDSDEKSKFTYISATTSAGANLFSVDGFGNIKTSGHLTSSGVNIEGHASINGGHSFARTSVKADEKIFIPVNSSFVVIEPDMKNQSNHLVFPLGLQNVYPGQMMVVLNQDEQATKNPVVPAGAAVVFIFDGKNWKDIQALSVPSQHLRDVQEFTAANDLSIGNVTLEVGRLGLLNANRGGIPFIGARGLLLTSDKFSITKNTLVTPALKVERIVSDVDFKGAKNNV